MIIHTTLASSKNLILPDINLMTTHESCTTVPGEKNKFHCCIIHLCYLNMTLTAQGLQAL